MSGVDWGIDAGSDDGEPADADDPADRGGEGEPRPSAGPGGDGAAAGWTRLRRLRVAFGVGAFVAGVLLVAGAGWLPLSGLAGALGGPAGRALVVMLGLVAALQALWAAVRARTGTPDLADPPDPEPVGPGRPPVAGEEVDAALERLADPGSPDADARERLREDLRRTAVTLLAERADCTRAEAATRVTRGEWTDDPLAAAFLGGPDAATVPLALRVREWLAPETPAGRRARRTADEVVALAEDEP